MKIKEILVATGAGLLLLFIAAWLMSETKILALQEVDKQFVDQQVSTLQRSVDEIHQEAQNLNNRLEGLEKLNRTLEELNSHLQSVEKVIDDIGDGANRIYEGMSDTFVEEFEKLNESLSQMHVDQIDLLETLKKLGERFNPFFGSDD